MSALSTTVQPPSASTPKTRNKTKVFEYSDVKNHTISSRRKHRNTISSLTTHHKPCVKQVTYVNYFCQKVGARFRANQNKKEDKMSISLTSNELLRCGTCLLEMPFGMFRKTESHVSKSDRPCFATRNMPNSNAKRKKIRSQE